MKTLEASSVLGPWRPVQDEGNLHGVMKGEPGPSVVWAGPSEDSSVGPYSLCREQASLLSFKHLMERQF